MNPCCENCAYWHFPTKSLYQALRTEGICVYYPQNRMTTPNDKCDKYKYELKHAMLHNAVAAANELLRKERFANIMNGTDEARINELKAELTLLESGKAINKELAGLQTAIDSLPSQTEFKPVKTMPADLIEKIDQITKPNRQAVEGEIINVAYTIPFIYTGTNTDDMGNVLQAILKRPDGHLMTFNVNECEFRTPCV